MTMRLPELLCSNEPQQGGYRGSGKSTILNEVVLWARRNDWLVVWIPDGE